MPKSRLIEKGHGLYFDYDTRNQLLIKEFIISGYKFSEIVVAYDIDGLRFHDVYDDLKFGKPYNIKIRPS